MQVHDDGDKFDKVTRQVIYKHDRFYLQLKYSLGAEKFLII